eukprot:9470842-Pyramimonas_sp.AAC.1
MTNTPSMTGNTKNLERTTTASRSRRTITQAEWILAMIVETSLELSGPWGETVRKPTWDTGAPGLTAARWAFSWARERAATSSENAGHDNKRRKPS